MFNLANYEDVDTRIHKFYETYPDGSILTELITNEEKEGIVIFKAVAYRTHVDTAASAIGYARGARKDRGVDRDFWFENCETSAIGRCLANLGLSAKGKRASSLEMAKVNEAQSDTPIRVRTESHKQFLQTTNPTAEIVWDTTIEPPEDVDLAFDNAIDLLKEKVGAHPLPMCKHGARLLKEGTGAKGAYRGWTCSLPMKRKAEQCKPIWMMLSKDGTWSFRPEDEELLVG
jgi:hypothetical protein